MYIKQLEKWNDSDWNMFFFSLPFWMREYREDEIRIILTSNSKQEIEAQFPRLKNILLINGVWPSWFTQKMRDMITWFFPYIRFEWHDIMFSIWWTYKDFCNANWGLLKYSIISLFMGGFNDVIMSPLSIAIIILFYLLVMTFWMYSFRWNNYLLSI